MKLQGKIAIVTGCNGEFGSAIVPGFAAEGCEIVCVDFKQSDADTAAEKVRRKGRRALALAIDLRKRTEVDAMVEQVIQTFGRIDILVNTTMASHNQEFLNFKEEDFDDSLSRGVKSYFLTCQAAARQMVKQRYGKIINLSSIVGVLGPGPSRLMDSGSRRGQRPYPRRRARAGILRHQCECGSAGQHGAEALQPRRSRARPPAAAGQNRDAGRHG
jgi:3-oxoacyl-[acyl-carrier protein] reductase